MGGINHQPCRHYLRESTRLSRCVSSARSHFEQGNIALEDIILLELEGKRGSLNPMRHHLQLSQDFLQSARESLTALESRMWALDYKDLAALHVIDITSLGKDLSDGGLVDAVSWEKMSTLMKESTFFASVRHFHSMLSELSTLTDTLFASVASLGDFADEGTLNSVLEENRAGNIKAPFARLYTAWGLFQADFLASSLVSTEVWYAQNGFGTLALAREAEKVV